MRGALWGASLPAGCLFRPPTPQAAEKGPDARRRPKAAGEAYDYLSPRLVASPLSSNSHEPAVKGGDEADGPLSAACDPERFREPPIRLKVIAVLPVAAGVLGLREEEAVAIARGRVRVVLEETGAQLLVVRVVAGLGGGGGERLDERRAVEAGLEVGGGPVDGLERAEPHEGLIQPLEQLVLGHGVGTAGRLDLDRAVPAHVPLVV